MIALVWAQTRTGVIGKNGRLPWHLPTELKHFQQLTLGKTVVMGRLTWEGLPQAPLRGRKNIVLSRDPDFKASGAEVHDSFATAYKSLSKSETNCVIGGRQVFKSFLDVADELWVSIIHKDYQGDLKIGKIPYSKFVCTKTTGHSGFDFYVYERR